jgi:hypothetical protein
MDKPQKPSASYRNLLGELNIQRARIETTNNQKSSKKKNDYRTPLNDSDNPQATPLKRQFNHCALIQHGTIW